MFHIMMTIFCAVFIIGYIIYTAAGQEDAPAGKAAETKQELATYRDAA